MKASASAGVLLSATGKADDGLAEHAAHAGFLGRLRHHVLEVVHVGEGGGAGEQHFEAAEARAPADEIRR